MEDGREGEGKSDGSTAWAQGGRRGGDRAKGTFRGRRSAWGGGGGTGALLPCLPRRPEGVDGLVAKKQRREGSGEVEEEKGGWRGGREAAGGAKQTLEEESEVRQGELD
jgi:hypothetical protein